MPDFRESVEAARGALNAARAALRDELAAYPTPVSGCDAQYNHLIAEDRRIADALAVLDTPYFVATPRQQAAGERVESR